MRIITGIYRSKVIHLPSFFTDRPTTDMAKESLFNLISNNFDYEDVRFLDLFAGSGSISYEMASRGCSDITCVDANKKYCDFINKNFAQMFPKKSPARVITADAFNFWSAIRSITTSSSPTRHTIWRASKTSRR